LLKEREIRVEPARKHENDKPKGPVFEVFIGNINFNSTEA